MSIGKIRIAVADDHQICRDGLISMLDPEHYDVVGEANNGVAIVELAKQKMPDVILMDIQMPKMDGIEATKIIAQTCPSIKVIALTMHWQNVYITEMIDAGASGYLLKTALKHEIIEAIQAAIKHKQYYCKTTTSSIAQIIKNNNSKTRLAFNLTDTEIKIINLICEEYNSDAIGRLLFLSKRTIDGARLRIQEKLEVNSIAGIVKFAIENGIYRRKDGI